MNGLVIRNRKVCGTCDDSIEQLGKHVRIDAHRRHWATTTNSVVERTMHDAFSNHIRAEFDFCQRCCCIRVPVVSTRSSGRRLNFYSSITTAHATERADWTASVGHGQVKVHAATCNICTLLCGISNFSYWRKIIDNHSFIHSLKLYKIADKTLLSNVNRKKWTMNDEKLWRASSVLEEHACKKVTVGKWRRPSGQLKVMCSLSQFVVLLTLWGRSGYSRW